MHPHLTFFHYMYKESSAVEAERLSVWRSTTNTKLFVWFVWKMHELKRK